jgi:hypothetical protein
MADHDAQLGLTQCIDKQTEESDNHVGMVNHADEEENSGEVKEPSTLLLQFNLKMLMNL